MARPAEIVTPTPSATPASAAAEEFDPLEFWLRYRSRILMYTTMVVVALALYLAYWMLQNSRRTNSEQALAGAKTAEDYRRVAEDYPHNAAGGNALLLLAGLQRGEGKFPEAASTLNRFIEKHPNHELISGAYASLAANQEAQGKLDEALATYKKVTTNYPTSFSAAAAFLSQGRVLQAQDKTEEARQAYEAMMAQFSESPFRQEAMGLLMKVKK